MNQRTWSKALRGLLGGALLATGVTLTAPPTVAATSLTLSTQAAGAAAGAAFSTQPIITVAGGDATVTATVSAGATLVGGTSVLSSGGTATFSTLGITAPAGTYTLAFSASGVSSVTQSVTVTAGAASKLGVTTAANGAVSGSAFTTQPVIAIQDEGGNTVTSSTAAVTAAVSSGATLVGTTTVTASNGVATFTNLGITGTASSTYTLTFTASGVTGISQNVTIPGAAVGLVVVTAPAGAANGAAFTTQPQIAINDGSGNRVTSSTANVTVSVSTGATLVGTTTVPATAGLASFTNLGITGSPGIPYTLTFASTGLTSVTATVTPVVGPGAKLSVTTQAAGAASGTAFTTQPQVTVQDTGGNTVSTSTATITATVSTGATLVGAPAIAAVSGVGRYTNLGVTGANGTYILTFSATGMTDTTQTITIGAGGGTAGVPTIVAVSPNQGSTNGGTAVTLSGTNFTGTTKVTFGTTAASNVVIVSPTQMTALTPTGPAGAVAVAVTNAAGTGTLSNGFTYTSEPSSTGQPVGDGVLLFSESDSSSAQGTALIKGVKSSGSAKTVSIPTGQATRIRMSGLPKKQKFTAEIKLSGSWTNIGKADSNNKGNAALRAIEFTKTGTYLVRLKKGSTSYYVKARA
jgi:hypothetical protein